jgi:hypothetical protein
MLKNLTCIRVTKTMENFEGLLIPSDFWDPILFPIDVSLPRKRKVRVLKLTYFFIKIKQAEYQLTRPTQQDSPTCSICLDLIILKKAFTLQCSHTFHEKCINKWLKKKRECPICRLNC